MDKTIEELIESLKNMTLDEKKAMAEKLEQRIAHIKKEPPASAETGTCVVCGNTVTGKHISIPTIDPRLVPIGPLSRDYFVGGFVGYSCDGCGLMYHFLPKKP